MWQSLSLDKLDVRCLFIDLPGHGQSEFSTTESPASGIEQMAIEVIAVIESLGNFFTFRNNKLQNNLPSGFVCDSRRTRSTRLF